MRSTEVGKRVPDALTAIYVDDRRLKYLRQLRGNGVHVGTFSRRQRLATVGIFFDNQPAWIIGNVHRKHLSRSSTPGPLCQPEYDSNDYRLRVHTDRLQDRENPAVYYLWNLERVANLW